MIIIIINCYHIQVKMFDQLLFYFIIIIYIIYIMKSVKNHRKIKKNIEPITKNITTPICINNDTYYFDNDFNKNISKLQTMEYNRPMFIQI